MYSWQINSLSEFNKLIDLSLAGVYSGNDYLFWKYFSSLSKIVIIPKT